MASDGPKLLQVIMLLLMVKMVQNLDIGHDSLGSPLSNIKVEVYLVNGIVMLILQVYRCLYDFSLDSGSKPFSLFILWEYEGPANKVIRVIFCHGFGSRLTIILPRPDKDNGFGGLGALPSLWCQSLVGMSRIRGSDRRSVEDFLGVIIKKFVVCG